MKEKLIIRNFGPIKDVELELGRFNVLIGENSTGKSIVAKVLASIYSLLNSAGEGTSGLMRQSELSSVSHFKKHLSVYEIHNLIKPNSFIKLSGNEINFCLENGFIEFNYEYLLGKGFLKSQTVTYIPADRIATSLFSNATWPEIIDIEEGRIDMPKYFLRYSSLFGRLKKARQEFDFTELLGVKFRHEDGIDKILVKDGNVISLNESASAIQSNLSLCLIVDWQSEKREENSCKTFIIEEPELNLFPVIQNKLVQFLSDKTMNYGNSILLTTHSPYILAPLNNLMEAYKTGKIDSQETGKIIEKKYWINPENVSAYMMLPNGHCEDIFDRKEGLIKSEKIDSVSNIINEQFDAFLNLEFSNDEFNTGQLH